jgi:hypothetical protein
MKTKKKILFWRPEGHWQKEQDPDPKPDPLVKHTGPRIRIRTKMSRIRNTDYFVFFPAKEKKLTGVEFRLLQTGG